MSSTARPVVVEHKAVGVDNTPVFFVSCDPFRMQWSVSWSRNGLGARTLVGASVLAGQP